LEHVLLRPDVTPGEVDDACASAVESGLAAVTVWPGDVPRAAAASDGSRVIVVAAIGGRIGTPLPAATLDGRGGALPTGATAGGPMGTAARGAVLDEARHAIRAGARHLAVALDPARMLGEGAAELVLELEALCRIAHAEGVHVRAVLQAPLAPEARNGARVRTAPPGVLPPGPLPPAPRGAGVAASLAGGWHAEAAASPAGGGLAEAGRLAVEAGADLLQTGFGLRAQATAEQVRAVRRALPSRHAAIGVIAGGAEDAQTARHLLERAGAVRVAVLDPSAVLRGVAAA
jgi:deoxyribose-phosphate aldolase